MECGGLPPLLQASLHGTDWSTLLEQHKEILYREWAHAPSHLFVPGGTYIITASTYQRALLFDSHEKRDFLMQSLFDEAKRWGWRLQAWAVLVGNAENYRWCSLGWFNRNAAAGFRKTVLSFKYDQITIEDNF